jgi:hypothetical protein
MTESDRFHQILLMNQAFNWCVRVWRRPAILSTAFSFDVKKLTRLRGPMSGYYISYIVLCEAYMCISII